MFNGKLKQEAISAYKRAHEEHDRAMKYVVTILKSCSLIRKF
ncbi:hypothetical protein [Metabacillus endolithicus]|nr:hypothetical protein [Metabacillus endolithicus]